MNAAWTYLLIAGILEVAWAIGLKYTHGFSRFWPSVGTLAGMVGSFYFLSAALKILPIGTAYAVWTGIGALGTALLGIVLFGESAALPRLLSIGLVILGILGLKLTSSV
ncbi:MAG: quaternary ammonium compound efflux SMR transporter SugE [Armatimonadetes bacterium]|nr:quaternary ammonium compound efflux SMR transporter SugE [Armatimonadota bacterium]